MENSKILLSDANLKLGIDREKAGGAGKLQIVKWVHDNSNKGLRDSKEFVDENL